jgi:hypothetical protein
MRAAEIFLTADSLKSTERKNHTDHLGVTVMHVFCFRSAFLTFVATAFLATPLIAQSATGTLALSATSYSVPQNAGGVYVWIKRTAPINPKTGYVDAASVSYATANSSAIAGTDYTAKSGVVTWGKGDLTTKLIVVPVSNAKPFAGTKAFALAIASPSAGSTISTASTIVTIDGDGKTTTPPAATKTATLTWAEPTTNTNGQALTNLAGYKILYGTSASSLSSVVQITNPSTLTYAISNLKAGTTWYFSILAYNTSGVDSPASAVVSKSM